MQKHCGRKGPRLKICKHRDACCQSTGRKVRRSSLPNFEKEDMREHFLQCGKFSNCQYRSATSTSTIALISITAYCPSMPIKSLPGQMLQNGFSRKGAKGARTERERRTWPGKVVVGHSGFYDKQGWKLVSWVTARLHTEKRPANQ